MRPRLAKAKIAAALAACGVLAIAGRAAAQDRPTLSGAWTASALSESWSVSEWGEACGPKPAGRGAGGGSVQIKEQNGELSISGAGRAFSTAECWEQMPGLSRVGHSASGGRSWRTRCASPANDPRRAAITTTMTATDSTIQLTEIGDYQFIIQDTKCHATVTRSRSFTLVRRDGDTPPPAATTSAVPSASAAPSAAPAATTAAPSAKAPPAASEPKPASKCSGPTGEPARLEVHPGRKLLRAGDRFTFRGIVTDANGCATGTKPAWIVQPGPLASKASVDANGTVTIEADAGEGQVTIGASVGDKGVSVIVEVASPSRYDAMLGESGLNDAGEAEQAAVAVIAAGTIGGRTTTGEDVARERKIRFVAIVGGLSAVLAFAALVIARRGRRRFDEGESEEAPPSSHAAPPAFEPTPDAPVAVPGAPAIAQAPPPARKPGRGKICPTCGERYESDATFCGKDATQLVLLN